MKAAPVLREIDGLTFEISQLGVRDARAAFVKLTNVLGPALSEFAKAADVTGAIGKAMTDIGPEDLDILYGLFAKSSKVKVGELFVAVDGAGETVFQGRMLAMFKWLWACAEVNFADFLDGLKGIDALTSLRSKGLSASTSPQG